MLESKGFKLTRTNIEYMERKFSKENKEVKNNHYRRRNNQKRNNFVIWDRLHIIIGK